MASQGASQEVKAESVVPTSTKKRIST